MKILLLLMCVALILDGIVYWIRYRMYYALLDHFKYTRIRYLSQVESLLYRLREMGWEMPFLLIKPNWYTISDFLEDFKKTVYKGEQILVVLEYGLELLRKIVGVRIVYIVYILFITWQKFGEQISEVSRKGLDFLFSIDYIALIQQIYDYIVDNGSGLLVVIVIALTIYVHYLRSKHSKYIIENIWDAGNGKTNQEVAEAQKKITKYINELYPKMNDNMDKLNILVR